MTTRSQALLRRALAVALGTCAGLAIGELALRCLLFAPGKLALRLGKPVRQAPLFARVHNDDYWKLQHLFLDPEERGSVPNPDPVLGWTGPVLPGVYRLSEDPPDDGRQLVLLYGDSFAQCTTPPEDCFARILEEGDLGSHFVLGNFGVGGYGLDQIYLLVKHSIDHYVDRRPIVAIGILVEDDLARSMLSFRGWPKPRLVVEDGLLVSEPVITDIERYLDAHPIAIGSYLARLLAINADFLPGFVRDPLLDPPPSWKAQADLNRRLLCEIDAELSARGLEHFYYLFHSPLSVAVPANERWREAFVLEVCRERSIRVLSSLPYLLAAAGGEPERCASFYSTEPSIGGHLNRAGNRVVFEGLRQGILGQFGVEDTRRVSELFAAGAFEVAASSLPSRRLLGVDALVDARDPSACVRAVEEASREGARTKLALRVLDRTATRVTWRLPVDARRLTASLHAFSAQDAACPTGRLVLEVRVSGRTALRFDVAAGEPVHDLDVDLSGARDLEISVQGDGDAPDCLWAMLDGARIE